MKNSKRILGLFVLVLAYASVGTAAAPPLTFKFKDVNAKGAIETDTYGVNDSNAITGDYIDSSGVQHGMILEGTKLTTIDDPKGTATTGNDINNAGVVVGYYTNRSNVLTGFEYSKRKFHDIAPPGSLATEALGINDKGDVVGLFIDSAGQHGFLRLAKTKKYTKLDVPGGYNTTTAWGINNQGWITLYAYDSTETVYSFLKVGKNYKKLAGPEGSAGTIARAINKEGDIVGKYFPSFGGQDGWLLLGAKKGNGGTYYTFGDPKAQNNTRADGLNDNRVIVGRYTPIAGGDSVGFEATVK
jgi:hypothetical protein